MTLCGKEIRQSSQCKFKDESNNTITNSHEISDKCNDFLYVRPKLALKPIVELEILKRVDQLKPNKNAGHDKIGNFIIKKVSDEIVKPLTCIFNLSLSTGIVLENLKVAKVIPIYKEDDAAVFSNYRPVSLLPCFSKNS